MAKTNTERLETIHEYTIPPWSDRIPVVGEHYDYVETNKAQTTWKVSSSPLPPRKKVTQWEWEKCIIAGAKGEIGLLAADSDSTMPLGGPPFTGQLIRSTAVVDLLLTSDKVQPNVANGDGDTAFSFAVQCCVEVSEVVRLLMKSDKIDIDRQGSLGKTTLSYAAETGNAELVQLLLNSKRVNPNHCDYGGLTPLLLAIKAVNLATFKVLWDSDQVDRHHKDPDGQTALHIAVNAFSERQGYNEILGLLMDFSDINVNAKDGGGSTALTQAM
ncbi:ankyrin repeats (many copies) domain-containing protein [Pochonia chlamydosporia 170]|uniref:Ankyrin repeats (Many copies) domain-containing protein n=1 Tax=Pochonia chlamydosporia 170 TaxID=1380566 RepID=A0A179EZT1_METCM|nr:ankyrin repeats (many copies) domain-containing protein [Pochonia chlamydosporia 170]OAQ58668.1 ankyrin repeats (many copies) domain-containing protein [Pochonia chlamydosporia 170]